MLSLALSGSLTTCTPPASTLEKVRRTGVLRVATVNSPTTYYLGADGPTGFEYDLAKGLATRLGVELQLEVVPTPPAALELVKSGRVDFAAAGLAVTPARAQQLRFSRPLLSVVPQLVYRMGQAKPRSWNEVREPLVVVAGSAHAERLRELQKQYPHLSWEETSELEYEELLVQVAEGEIAYTIANSDLVSINQRYYPQLRVAFAVSDAQELAWAFPQSGDDSLYSEAVAYLHQIGDTELARLRDRHFGHVEHIDYVGAVALATHVDSRLPRYRAAFEEAAQLTGLDWRLLAAIGYQESRWDPQAVSPTGVRGIMQLTRDTAVFLKVSDRDDPLQSIMGGARYFRRILDSLPPRIAEPDRSWLALAAYNMGAGHLFDAQNLTARLGGDPTRWLDVRNSLPLLTQARWHRQTKHGYARGRQAIAFVGNVRTYYDMLVWMTGGPQAPQPAPREQIVHAETPESAPGARPQPIRAETGEVLSIKTPLL